jgi:Zn ribbon nucleic-acid-binding protein
MIDKTCPKCGHEDNRVKWCPAFDRLDLNCIECGYQWSREPMQPTMRMQPVDKSVGVE